jgi:predicted ribosome quality control (RQC) complex YloA/Tae2 family protein
MVRSLRKKEFSSIDIAAAIKEIQPTIADSRVNNIYQIGEKTLIFKLHKTDMPPIRLVIEAGRRIHITSYAEENPSEPPAFCMTMRKYLRDSWLRKIEQTEFERIATLHFDTKTGTLKLVVEFFGDGNFILTNEKDVIIHAFDFKKMRDRDILHNVVLKLPPPSGKNPFKVTQTELAGTLNDAGQTEVVRALARFLGIGGGYTEELLLRARVDKTKSSKALTSEEVTEVFGSLQSLLTTLQKGKFEPSIILGEDGDFVDVVPFKLERYERCKIQSFLSFNAALDEFYLRVTAAEKAGATIETDKFKQEAQRLKRLVLEQEKSVTEDQLKAERDKQIGDTIYAHFTELQTFQEQILKANQQGHDWNTIVTTLMAAKKTGKPPASYVESFDGKNLALNLCIDSYHFS